MGVGVFVGEGVIDNPGSELRPGMRGRMRIEAGSRNLLRTVFERPWYAFSEGIRVDLL